MALPIHRKPVTTASPPPKPSVPPATSNGGTLGAGGVQPEKSPGPNAAAPGIKDRGTMEAQAKTGPAGATNDHPASTSGTASTAFTKLLAEGKEVATEGLQGIEATMAHLHNRRVTKATGQGSPATRDVATPVAKGAVVETNTAQNELTTHPAPASGAVVVNQTSLDANEAEAKQRTDLSTAGKKAKPTEETEAEFVKEYPHIEGHHEHPSNLGTETAETEKPTT
jgi:hypothetical protein